MPIDDFGKVLAETNVTLYDADTMTDNLLDMDIVRPENLVNDWAGKTISIDALFHLIGAYCQEHRGTDRNQLLDALAPPAALRTIAAINERRLQQTQEFDQDYREQNRHLRD